jgi:hypothetical protein
LETKEILLIFEFEMLWAFFRCNCLFDENRTIAQEERGKPRTQRRRRKVGEIVRVQEKSCHGKERKQTMLRARTEGRCLLLAAMMEERCLLLKVMTERC